MSDQFINSIQEQLLELTNKKFSKIYIQNYICPIFEYIISSNKKKFLISGAQGIGKSTLLKILEKNLKIFYNKKILSLSLDNYYLTKKQRIILSKKIHPLLLTRGVPGTHDTTTLLRNIKKFEQSKYPIKLPIFNKLTDDQSKKFKLAKSASDILLLEGWCCGCPPLLNSYLFQNINSLEKEKDRNKEWRKFYNKKLKKQYAQIFNRFEAKFYLKPPSFSYIANWRLKQEKMMRSRNKNGKAMDKKEILEFISYYEKITKWMMKKMPYMAELTIEVDTNQKIKKIKIKPSIKIKA